jgi:hypothetical protein
MTTARSDRPLPAHLVAVLVYAALAIALTWPLASHLHDGLLGAGVGDNATFVWNFWWIRSVLHGGVSPAASAASPFWTPALFAPIGTSLVLHTTTLLPTVTATLLLPQAEPLVTHNAAVIVTVFLNGLCAYGAAYALTRQPAAALVAGLVFAASPFLTARLQGHFNVLSAWGLPLLVMALARESRRPGIGSAILVAGAIAVLAYTDYYYAVFGLVLVATTMFLQDRRIEIASTRLTPLTQARRWTLRGLVPIVLGLIAVIGLITLSGGTELTVAGLHVSARSTFNLRGVVWILAIVAVLVWKWPRMRFARADTLSASAARAGDARSPTRDGAAEKTPQLPQLEASPRRWRSRAAGVAVLIVLLLPLLIAIARLFAQHDYASQTYLWRSAPPGIDAGALVLGNPWHPLYGAWIRSAYARAGIDAIESAVWLGVLPMACLGFAALRLRAEPEVRRWLVLIALFFVWALGPYLMLFGANTGFMLPQTALRFVPLLANARIPGRAFVMVTLGVAVMVAFVLASDALRARRGLFASLAALIILIDYWPGPQPFVPLDRPALYTALRSLPPGPVLDLPLGMRDGFGERGHLDHRALFYQTLHEHPIAGGFVARLSPRVRRAYEDDPIFGPLLANGTLPSTPPPLREGAAPVQSLACAFQYVIVPKTSGAQPRSVDLEMVNRVFRLERLDGDDARDLYRVTGWQTPYCH